MEPPRRDGTAIGLSVEVSRAPHHDTTSRTAIGRELEPAERTATWESGGPPETWPSTL